MALTITDYPFLGGAGGSGAIGQQSGLAVGPFPADGSAIVNIGFPVPYKTSVTGVSATINNPSRVGTDELTIQVSSIALNGFNVYIAGGLPGSTASVFWIAQGT